MRKLREQIEWIFPETCGLEESNEWITIYTDDNEVNFTQLKMLRVLVQTNGIVVKKSFDNRGLNVIYKADK
jgi:hypothetical protein